MHLTLELDKIEAETEQGSATHAAKTKSPILPQVAEEEGETPPSHNCSRPTTSKGDGKQHIEAISKAAGILEKR